MDKKIKVLWVTNAFGCGGAERQMLYMYHILQEHSNFDITILYYARVGDELNFDGVKTHYIDKAKLGNVKTMQQIRKFVKENNFDIVHAFGGCSANIYGRVGAAFSKAVPVGAMLGKKHFASKGVALVNSVLNLFGNWWTVNNAELTPILKKDLAFVRENRVRLLHNGFVSAAAVDYKRGEKTEYDLDKGDNFVFAVVGRLAPVKNYPLFIKAAAQIAKKYENVRFWVVGNGPESENLNALAQLGLEDKVRFWGYRTDIDVAMDRADVFVQTSFTEGSPNTIAEAMRAGKPIISTKSTDLSEMIDQGKNGYVVENDSLSGLTETMESVLNMDKEQLEAAGRLSYELFERYFLDVKVAAEFEAFYREILKK